MEVDAQSVVAAQRYRARSVSSADGGAKTSAGAVRRLPPLLDELQVEVPLGVDLGDHSSASGSAIADEFDVVAGVQILIAIQSELVNSGAALDDQVEAHGDLG